MGAGHRQRGDLAGVPFWIPLISAGLIYAFAARKILALLIPGHRSRSGLGCLCARRRVRGAPRASAATVQVSTLALFIAGLKGGLLTFGGAYTAIPYVRADTVGRGWLADGTFLDGVAIAGILPAPLVIFATFAGFVAGGWSGAAAITAGMFLPAFAFSLVFFERLEAIVENPALHRLLGGVAAAVVGVIAATLAQLGWSTVGRASDVWAAAAIFAAAAASSGC